MSHLTQAHVATEGTATVKKRQSQQEASVVTNGLEMTQTQEIIIPEVSKNMSIYTYDCIFECLQVVI